jgi:hypothetical protein
VPNEPAAPPSGGALLVDGHVHFHCLFSWRVFLDAAVQHFARARAEHALAADAPGCLMFTESAGVHAWRSLLEDESLTRPLGWQLERGDRCGAILHRRGHDPIVILAGRQIVTAERLEVLALGCVRELPDGRPTQETADAVVGEGALPVIPWGFGKWLGARAAIVRDVVAAMGPRLYLGDNGGRPRSWPRPGLLAWAEARQTLVLNGSDPLPLPDQAMRAGSYGFVATGWRDDAPGARAIDAVRALRRTPPTFGGRSSLVAAARAQAGIRWRPHRSRQAGHNVATA